MPSRCPTCGEEGTPSALYCGACGSRLVLTPPGTAAVDPFIGRTLNGTYFIQQKVGAGGMGDVYKAIHQKLDAPVALKIVRRELLTHPSMIHRFQREARAASRLRHPNVVAVTDFGQAEDGTIFMVMEYVTGTSLARAIASDAPFPEPRVVRIGAQILSALAEAHANDILHRDLKPENVMIESRRDAADSVKVLDFGVAKILAPDATASTLTQVGLVCGTPGYMSPEQLQGRDIDARSDLFSVGVVLYEMLTQKLPFNVPTPMEMLHKQLSDPIPPPGERRGHPVSPMLEQVVMQALSPAREERPPSADEMRAELLAATLLPVAEDRHATRTTEVYRRDEPSRPLPAAVKAPQPAAPRRGTAATRPQRAPALREQGSAVSPAPQPSSAGEPQRQTRPPTAVRAERPRAGTTGAALRAGTATVAAAARASPLDPAVLKRIESKLAPMVGPVAPHLVRKASRTAKTLGDLCRQVTTFIESVDDRRSFLEWSKAELRIDSRTSQRPVTPAPAQTPQRTWDPAVLDRARSDVAVHLGPLARVLVLRASSRARDVRELYELLALEIPGEAERERFRSNAPRFT